MQGAKADDQILVEPAADHRQYDKESKVEQDRSREQKPPALEGQARCIGIARL